jgi:cytosine/adenosine deaminase-related metal-dependent hydrolase
MLTGGVVLTGPEWVPQRVDVRIEGDVIVAVGASLSGPDQVDVSGRLITPGLVNGHTHSHTLPSRGVARSWTLEDSLLNGSWMAAARSEELAELSALLAATEMIASGATGAFDLVAQTGGPDVAGLAAVARGYHRAGLRTVLAPMVADRTVHSGIPAIGDCCGIPDAGLPASDIVDRCRSFASLDLPPLVTAAVAPTILAHCSPALVDGLRDLASELDLRIHTHLAESKPQALAGAERFGHSITAELARVGLLTDRLTVAHGIWLSAADRALLASAGAIVVTVPGSNLRLGSGVANTRALLEAGVPLAVGTDGANSADALDVLDAARLTALLGRSGTSPSWTWLSVEEVLDAATVGGAAACGWSDVGRIEEGYAADLALLNLGSRAFLPANDLPNQLLTAARAADVTDVLVAGRWVYRNRTFPDLDLGHLFDRFRELCFALRASTASVREAATLDTALAAETIATLRANP